MACGKHEPRVYKCSTEPEGCFFVQLWVDNVIKNITLDDFVPVVEDYSRPKYTQVYSHTIVLPLIEKAFAKILNGYENFNSNYFDFSTAVLFNGKLINPQQERPSNFENNCMVLGTDETERNLMGLTKHHAYAKISVNPVTNLVRVFNGHKTGGVHFFYMRPQDINFLFDDILVINFFNSTVKANLVDGRLTNTLPIPVHCLIAKARQREYAEPFASKKLCVQMKVKEFCVHSRAWNVVCPVEIQARESVQITNGIGEGEFVWGECFIKNE